jgi:hypothetical protein
MYRTLIAGTVVLVLGLAFLITAVIDDLAPAGTTDIITVWDVDASDGGAFQTLVRATADAHDMTVLKEVRSNSGRGVERLEYVANPAASQGLGSLDHETTGFDPTLVTGFLPFSDLPDNRINGMYVTDAGTASARSFAASLTDTGVAVTVNPLSPLFVSLWVVSEVPAVPLVGCLVIAILIGVTAWQASRRNASAIAAVHGWSILRSATTDAALIAVQMVVCGSFGLGLAALVLTMYNGASRLGTFALAATLGIVASAMLTASLTVIAAVVPTNAITQSIAGKRPWRTLLGAAMAGNIVALALASGAATTSWSSIDLARRDAQENHMWRGSLDDVQMTFESSVAELDAAESGLASVYTRLDSAGSAILADHPIAPDLSRHAPDLGNVLIVNAQYLREQSIRSSEGSRVLPEDLDPHALSLLVPEDIRLTKSDRRAWREFLAFQRDNSTDPSAVPRTIGIVETGVETGRVFDYATDDLASTSTQDSPVIAVLPAASASVSENYLAANMTTGEVVFTDEGALRSELAEHGLARAVATIEPLRDFVTYRSAVLHRELKLAVGSLVVVFLVLLWSAALTGQAVSMIRGRRTMIEVLHGRRLVAAMRPALGLPAGLIAAATTVLVATGPSSRVPAVFANAAIDIAFVSVVTAAHIHEERMR